MGLAKNELEQELDDSREEVGALKALVATIDTKQADETIRLSALHVVLDLYGRNTLAGGRNYTADTLVNDATSVYAFIKDVQSPTPGS